MNKYKLACLAIALCGIFLVTPASAEGDGGGFDGGDFGGDYGGDFGSDYGGDYGGDSIRVDIRITPIRVVLTKTMLSTRTMSLTSRKILGWPMMRSREMI